MMRTTALFLTLALLAGCSPASPPEETDATGEAEATATDGTSTADDGGGYVDKVTRAQGKAKAIAEAESERAAEVDRELEQP